jgi:hypothetical protein
VQSQTKFGIRWDLPDSGETIWLGRRGGSKRWDLFLPWGEMVLVVGAASSDTSGLGVSCSNGRPAAGSSYGVDLLWVAARVRSYRSKELGGSVPADALWPAPFGGQGLPIAALRGRTAAMESAHSCRTGCHHQPRGVGALQHASPRGSGVHRCVSPCLFAGHGSPGREMTRRHWRRASENRVALGPCNRPRRLSGLGPGPSEAGT